MSKTNCYSGVDNIIKLIECPNDFSLVKLYSSDFEAMKRNGADLFSYGVEDVVVQNTEYDFEFCEHDEVRGMTCEDILVSKKNTYLNMTKNERVELHLLFNIGKYASEFSYGSTSHIIKVSKHIFDPDEICVYNCGGDKCRHYIDKSVEHWCTACHGDHILLLLNDPDFYMRSTNKKIELRMFDRAYVQVYTMSDGEMIHAKAEIEKRKEHKKISRLEQLADLNEEIDLLQSKMDALVSERNRLSSIHYSLL